MQLALVGVEAAHRPSHFLDGTDADRDAVRAGDVARELAVEIRVVDSTVLAHALRSQSLGHGSSVAEAPGSGYPTFLGRPHPSAGTPEVPARSGMVVPSSRPTDLPHDNDS